MEVKVSTIDEEFEKSRVKAHIRTRKGKMERVKEYQRTGEKRQIPRNTSDKKIVDFYDSYIKGVFPEGLDSYESSSEDWHWRWIKGSDKGISPEGITLAYIGSEAETSEYSDIGPGILLEIWTKDLTKEGKDKVVKMLKKMPPSTQIAFDGDGSTAFSPAEAIVEVNTTYNAILSYNKPDVKGFIGDVENIPGKGWKMEERINDWLEGKKDDELDKIAREFNVSKRDVERHLSKEYY